MTLSASPTPDAPNSRVPTSIIIGATVGGAACIALAVAVVVLVVMRRRRRSKQELPYVYPVVLPWSKTMTRVEEVSRVMTTPDVPAKNPLQL